MAYTPVEIIALIVVVLAVVKMVVLLVKPSAWMNLAKSVWAKHGVVKVVSFVLAAIVLYYLIISGITIVQIMAVTAFVALLIMIGLASEVGPLIKKYDAMIKKGNIWKEYWLYALIWIILIVWAGKELLM